MKINIEINGLKKDIEIDPSETLLDALRKTGLKSVRRSCDTSSCGVCTVLMDGLPILSCSLLAARAEKHKITTIEGIQEEASEFANFMVAEGAEQCGFCSPGLVLCIYAMKNESKNISAEEIDRYLAGNLCRCSGYEGQRRAIYSYMGVRRYE